MFDLIALAFDADITRSVAFMLNREDGMGISDTFRSNWDSRKHTTIYRMRPTGRAVAVCQVRSVLEPAGGPLLRALTRYQDRNGSVLDNTIVLFGSGASTTHNPRTCRL
jgi:hypothetical protein